MNRKTLTRSLMIAAALVATGSETAFAEDAVSAEMFTTNNLWMMIAAALVFIMHLGFATLESGLTRAKNTTNILFKNTFIVCIGILTYAFVGFNLMYPGDFSLGQWFGFAGFFVATDAAGQSVAYADGNYTYWTDFLFQAMFAATAATIVSGAVAERVKLGAFMVFSTIFVGLIYPWLGSWKWGAGWLDVYGFYDFAGSTLVHSVGGWGALAGAMLLGPRIGKYTKDGRLSAIPGSNLPMATIGVFLLWLGWFGFNGGSVLNADPSLVSLTLVTTCLAAAAGCLSAMATSWFALKKPDLTMSLNGILAGLVGITAGADQMAMWSSISIGLVAGVLVVYAVLAFDKIGIDDPVGAISVHLVCGIWGTLAVGLFGEMAGGAQFVKQLVGVLAYGAVAFPAALAIFGVLRATIGIRVDAEDEMQGLDISEHGMTAYPDFQTVMVGHIHPMSAPAGGSGSVVAAVPEYTPSEATS